MFQTNKLVMQSVLLIGVCLAHVVTAQRLPELNTAIGNLSCRMLSNTAKDGTDVVYSPFNIAHTLAQEETLKSIRTTMGLTSFTDEEIRRAFGTSAEKLKEAYGFILKTTNRIYMNRSHPISGDYIHRFRESDVEHLNFFGDPAGVQSIINHFVNEKTNGIFPKILENFLPRTTQLIIANTLYFKAIWAGSRPDAPASINSTLDTCCKNRAAFNGRPTKWVRRQLDLKYVDSPELQARIMEMPYVSTGNLNASLLLIVPEGQHKQNLHEWIKDHLKWDEVVAAVKLMETKNIEVTLPQGQIEGALDVDPPHSQLRSEEISLKSANSGDFKERPRGNNGLNRIVHRSKLFAFETGTEAAAVVLFKHEYDVRNRTTKGDQHFRNGSIIAVVILRDSEDSIVPIFTSIANTI